jgi:DNA-binding HxlR family transcriptional regulator
MSSSLPIRDKKMHLRDEPITGKPSEASEHEMSDFCPAFQYAVELVGSRWVGAIIRALVAQPRRFNELLAAIPGISDRLLTERLRELERQGIVRRVVHGERPVRVSYELTSCGRSLEPVVRSVAEWAETWVHADANCAQSSPSK